MTDEGKNYKIALCQMNSGDDPAANLADAVAMIEQAAAAGAKLACLPELFTSMSADPAVKRANAEQPGDGPAQKRLAELAAQLGIHIAAGSIPIAVDGEDRINNRSLLFGPAGEPLAAYDKIHLFRYQAPDREYDESLEYLPGSDPVHCDTGLGRIGLSVCYDIRFPELYRSLQEPDLMLVPSAFTRSTGKAHWEILLRARAIENQCYVVAAAQCGSHPGGIRTWGHSMVVNPWGEAVVREEDESGVLFAEVSAAAIADCRMRLPALANRAL